MPTRCACPRAPQLLSGLLELSAALDVPPPPPHTLAAWEAALACACEGLTGAELAGVARAYARAGMAPGPALGSAMLAHM